MKSKIIFDIVISSSFLVACLGEAEENESKKFHANKRKKQPNVMVIFADDVGTGDVPGYWENTNGVKMPNLKQLVADGTTFTDAHSSPLCAPSRYTFLSGNYPHRGSRFAGTWVINYDEEGSQFRKGQKSIAGVFRNKGYETAAFGKWHIGGKNVF